MQYSIGNKINSGRFGNVYRVNKDGNIYAAKILPKHRIDIPDHVNSTMIQREINNHKKVNGHHNIVKLFDVIEHWGNFFIIEEYCEKGDLNELINRKHVENEIVKKILKNCLEGLIACHQAGFIYGDLKPANILVDDHDNFKLCDFGGSDYARDLYTGSKHIRGTPAYIAPETYVFNKEHGFISDMWSLGVIAYILLYERYPFDVENKITAKEFKLQVLKNEIKYEHIIDKEAEDFIRRCLQKEADKRMTPMDALNHPFLAYKTLIL